MDKNADFKFEVQEQGVYIVGMSNSSTKNAIVIIPSEIEGKRVVGISDLAFMNCTSLEHIFIQSKLDFIGTMAFWGCTALKGIVFQNILCDEKNDKVEKKLIIKENAIPSHIPGMIFVENEKVLNWIEKRNVHCNIFVMNTKDYMFDYHNMKLVIYNEMPNFNENGEQCPWYPLRHYVEEVVLIETKQIGEYAFQHFDKLRTVDMNDSLENIQKYAFSDCINLNNIFLSQRIVRIYSHAFYNCMNLYDIWLPETLKLIGSHAFAESGLCNIVIPASVETIGTSAFLDCRMLKEVYIQRENHIQFGSTKNRMQYIFYHINSEAVIYTKNTEIKNLHENCENTTTIVTPKMGFCGYWQSKENQDRKENAVCWKLSYDGILTIYPDQAVKECGEYFIKDYDDEIAPWMQYNGSISQVIVKKEIVGIGKYAFFGCHMLQLQVEYPNCQIGEGAFEQCNNLISQSFIDFEYEVTLGDGTEYRAKNGQVAGFVNSDIKDIENLESKRVKKLVIHQPRIKNRLEQKNCIEGIREHFSYIGDVIEENQAKKSFGIENGQFLEGFSVSLTDYGKEVLDFSYQIYNDRVNGVKQGNNYLGWNEMKKSGEFAGVKGEFNSIYAIRFLVLPKEKSIVGLTMCYGRLLCENQMVVMETYKNPKNKKIRMSVGTHLEAKVQDKWEMGCIALSESGFVIELLNGKIEIKGNTIDVRILSFRKGGLEDELEDIEAATGVCNYFTFSGNAEKGELTLGLWKPGEDLVYELDGKLRKYNDQSLIDGVSSLCLAQEDSGLVIKAMGKDSKFYLNRNLTITFEMENADIHVLQRVTTKKVLFSSSVGWSENIVIQKPLLNIVAIRWERDSNL